MLETNDPKLTAFALGELPAEEQAEVAVLVAASPALAGEVAAIRGLGERLTALLSTETCPTLSHTERSAILQAAELDRPADVSLANPPVVRPSWYRQRRIWAYATAATLLLAVTLFFAIPLVARYTQEPIYRSSAWLRVEEIHLPSEPSRHEDLKGVPAKTAEVEVPDDSIQEDSPFIMPLVQLQSRITSKEVEQALLKAQAEAYEEKLAAAEITVNEEAVELEALATPDVRQMEQEIVNQKEITTQILAASGKGPQDPRFVGMQQQIREMERRRNELLDRSREKIRDRRIAEEKKRRQESLDKALARIEQNQLEIDLLREKFVKQRADLVKFKRNGLSFEVAWRESELKRQEEVVEMISARIMRLRTEYNGPAKVTLLRKAEPAPAAKTKSIWAFWFGEHEAKDTDEFTNVPDTLDSNRDYLTTQIQLLHSPLILEQALARPDVAGYEPLANAATPVAWLSERLSVNTANDELFIIDFECADPNYAAIITNAIVEAYFRMHTQDEAQRSTRVVELLEDERARRMVVIQQLRDQLKEIKARMVGREQAPRNGE